jgi:HEAT repeat protein
MKNSSRQNLALIFIFVLLWSHPVGASDGSPPVIEGQPVRALVRLAAQEGPKGEEARDLLDSYITKEDDAIRVIAECLKDKEEGVRVSTAKVLERLGPKGADAITLLQSALMEDESAWVRQRAASALDKVGHSDSKVQAALVRAMKEDKDAEVRGAVVAIFWSWQSGTRNAVSALKDALQDGEFEVRRKAAHAIAKHATPEDAVEAILGRAKKEKLDGIEPFAWALGETGSGGVPMLVKSLGDDDQKVRATAVQALGCVTRCDSVGKVLVKKQVPLVVALLEDKSALVRSNAAWALGFIGIRGDERAVEALLRGITDGDEYVRLFCLRSLNSCDVETPAVFANAVRLLKDSSVSVRLEAADLLRKSKESVPALVDTLKNDGSILVRREAARSLREMGPDAIDAEPVLKQMLKDDDAQLREIAREALHRIREKKDD